MKDLSARFYDLEAHQFEDGTVRLSQHYGVEDPSVIDLHPQQLRHLAEQTGLIAPVISRGVEVQLWRLYEHAGELADYLGAVPSFPPQPGETEDQRMANGLFEDLETLLTELGLIVPEQEPAKAPKSAQKSDDIYQQDLELGGASCL